MADVITRFRLETTEYDSKLKNATQALRNLMDSVNVASGSFSTLSDGAKKLAGSFGTIETGANNARDRLRELVTAYNDMAKQYNVLTRDLQQSDVGQAIAGQMQVLKDRIAEAKNELYNTSEQMKETGGSSSQLKDFLDQLAGKFGLNIGQLTKFGGALALATGAVKVIGDSFKTNEQDLDNWGMTVETSKALYEGFLIALNRGDISGFLSNIDRITQAARDAYNAMDELNEFNAFNQINFERARAGLTNAIVDYREGSGTKESVQGASNKMIGLLKGRQKYEWDKYTKAVTLSAEKNHVSPRDLMKALSGQWGDWTELRDLPMTGQSQIVVTGGGMFGGGSSYQKQVAANERERLGSVIRTIPVEVMESLQAVGAKAVRTENEIASQRRQLDRVLRGPNGPSTRGGGGTTRTVSGASVRQERELTGLIEIQEKKIKDLRDAMRQATTEEGIADFRKQLKEANDELDRLNGKAEKLDTSKLLGVSVGGLKGAEAAPSATVGKLGLREQIQAEMNEAALEVDTKTLTSLIETSMQFGIDNLNPQFDILYKRIGEGVNIPDEAWEQLEASINEKLKMIGVDPINLDLKTGEAKKGDGGLGNSVKETGKYISSISSIASGVEQLGIELPEGIQKGLGVLQGLMSILTGISSLISLLVVLNEVDTFIPFARGGIVHAAGGYKVPGNKMSGDKVPAMLNSGELVLNRAQQGNLASQLYGTSNLNNLNLTATISGEQIRLALNNSSRRRGRGEYVTSKTIR